MIIILTFLSSFYFEKLLGKKKYNESVAGKSKISTDVNHSVNILFLILNLQGAEDSHPYPIL